MLFWGKWHFGHICALETIQKLFTQMFIHYATNFKLSTECSYQLPINLACGILLQHLMWSKSTLLKIFFKENTDYNLWDFNGAKKPFMN